ncbi:MAG: carboxypeptidase-like regulatory domain-containing protein [Saprospiraceae bacterium]
MKKFTYCPPIILLLILCFGFNEVSFAQKQAFNIRGNVYNATTRQPIQNVMVSLKTSPSNANISTVYTDSLGNYLFSTRETPPFIVQAFASGYKTEISEPFSPGNERLFAVKSIYMQPTETKPAIYVAQPKIVPVPNFVESKFVSLNVLPTQGAYDLFYALNPELKNVDSVSANYVCKLPQFPPMTKSTKTYFKTQFKIDKEKNKGTQSELLDSISRYSQLYIQLTGISDIKSPDLGTSKKLLLTIQESLQSYERKIKKTRNAKAMQIMNLTSACSEIVQKCIRNHAVNKHDFQKLKNILEDLSILLPSDAYQKFVSTSNLTGFGHGGALTGVTTDSGNNIFQTDMDDDFEASDMSKMELSNMRSLRPFAFAIWKLVDGNVVLKDTQVIDKYFVYYFPPALQEDTLRYHKCSPAATYAQVTLPKARFGIKVVNSSTNSIVRTTDETFDTADAFNSPEIKEIFGVKYKLIIIEVKD